MEKLTGPIAGVQDTFASEYAKDVAERKAGSKSKYGFVQKPGFNIPWLSSKRLAEQLDISVKTLERMRKDGSGPPFTKVGGRMRYPIIGLEAWLDAGMQETNSDSE